MLSAESNIYLNEKNVWEFPRIIGLESSSGYLDKFEDICFDNDIKFDLTKTENVHSSFIGFLINLKQKTDKCGGHLTIYPSESLERLFGILKLHDYFFEE